MKIERYGLTLRFVEQEDAQFIVKLRTDEKLSRFLSPTSSDIKMQQEWIAKYKEREHKGEEYYFITEYQGVICGTTRIYNIEDDCFEIGSWLFSADSPGGVPVLADIITREFAFEKLKISKCRFEVRKLNKAVVKYHKSYNPQVVGEDELNYYFVLSRESFNERKNKLVPMLFY